MLQNATGLAGTISDVEPPAGVAGAYALTLSICGHTDGEAPAHLLLWLPRSFQLIKSFSCTSQPPRDARPSLGDGEPLGP